MFSSELDWLQEGVLAGTPRPLSTRAVEAQMKS
jgi:hypothetical protein